MKNSFDFANLGRTKVVDIEYEGVKHQIILNALTLKDSIECMKLNEAERQEYIFKKSLGIDDISNIPTAIAEEIADAILEFNRKKTPKV